MREHFIMGLSLREKYPELLTKFRSSSFHARSIDGNKNMMSAFCHLQGVFYQTGPNIKDDIDLATAIPPFQSDAIQKIVESNQYKSALPDNVQPVPIYAVPLLEDQVLRSYQACVRSEEWAEQNIHEAQPKYILDNDFKKLRKYLKGYGIHVNDWESLTNLAETALANNKHGLQMPADINPKSQFFKDLKFAYEYYYVEQMTSRERQKQAYAKPLLDAILSYLDRGNKNAIFLSANERTLIILLSAFNVLSTECLLDNYRKEKHGKPIDYQNCTYPHSPSNFIFEFYNEEDGTASMAFKYNGKSLYLCDPAKQENCKYIDFIDAVHKATGYMSIEEYNMLCNPGPQHHPDYSNYDRRYNPTVIISSETEGFTSMEVVLLFFCSFASVFLLIQLVLNRGKGKNSQFRHRRLQEVDESARE